MSLKLLITGAEGMLGKNIALSSKFKKYKLYTTSRQKLDLKNIGKVEKFIKKINPDIEIHCAAKVGGILDNIENPLDYINDNFLINYNVINTCYKLKIKKLINIGSSCAYPKNYTKKIKEEDLLKGELEETNEPYALSKIFSLKLCSIISKKKGYNYITIIPCNLYGPYNNFDLKKTHLLSAIIKKTYDAYKMKKTHVVMWGNGSARREFLYISDLVDFLYLCCKKINKIPNVINVGYGKDFTVKKLYELVLTQINPKIKIVKNTKMPVGQKYKLMNINKATKIGWRPKISINKGIELTIKYLEKVSNK